MTLTEYKEGLIESLKWFGYTCVNHEYVDNFNYVHEIFKPYRVHEGDIMPDLTILDTVLTIYHGTCYYCIHRKGQSGRWVEHARHFLKELIPIIGRLDAHAVYDPGEHCKRVPRLHIYL